MKATKPSLEEKLLTTVLVLIFMSLSLGQLLRIKLGFGAIYPHDLLIGLFLLIKLSQLKNQLSPIKLKTKLTTPNWRRWWFELLAGVFFALNLVYLALLKTDLISSLYQLRILYYASFGFLLHTHLKTTRVKNLKHWPIFLMIIWFTTLFGFFQYKIFYDLRVLSFLDWDAHLGRLASTLLDPNFAGFLIALGLVYWQAWQKKLTFWWLGNLSLILGLTLTFSRASYLVATIGLVTSAMLTKKPKKKLIYLITLGLFVLNIIFVPKPPGDGGKLLRTTSIQARLLNDLRIVADKLPVLGSQHLIANQVVKLERKLELKKPKVTGSTPTKKTDNSFKTHARWPNNLEIFLLNQAGLVGLGLFFFGLFRWGRKLFKKNQLAGIFLAMLFIHAQFNNTAFEPFVFLIFWGTVGEVLRLKLDI